MAMSLIYHLWDEENQYWMRQNHTGLLSIFAIGWIRGPKNLIVKKQNLIEISQAISRQKGYNNIIYSDLH